VTTTDDADLADWADAGLLAPGRVATPVEAAVGDRAVAAAMLDAEAALARAQAAVGDVPAAAAAAITAAARVERLDVRALAVAAREAANPVVAFVPAFTAVVARDDPAAAEHVHRGGTSQDILDTALMLVARRALELVRADLARVVGALTRIAADHRDTAAAGRTLALHAVPTTFGLKAAGWRSLVLDADARLAALLDGGLPVALGGAAGTLAAYLEHARAAAGPGGTDDGHADRLVDAFAAETGLARPELPWHALRTPVVDLASALTSTATALGKMAVDVQVLTRTEVAEVAEPGDDGRGGSSAMPQKRNPVLSTYLRSAAVQVPPLASGLAQCAVTEDERSAGLWHAEWAPLRECLRLVGGAAHAAAELAEGLEVRPARMDHNLGLTGASIVSERLAAALAPHLGKARAKSTLAAAARDDRPLSDVLADDPDVAAVLSRDQLDALVDPRAYTGAAGVLVDRALGRHPR
jgi:3-carboxy-cis,cis-muconate cycloisomerase